MKNEDFKHSEFDVMSKLWAIYKKSYDLLPDAVPQTQQLILAQAEALTDAPLAMPFAEILMTDIARQAAENAGEQIADMPRVHRVMQIVRWWRGWMRDVPEPQDDAVWEQIVREVTALGQQCNQPERELLLALMGDLESESKKRR